MIVTLQSGKPKQWRPQSMIEADRFWEQWCIKCDREVGNEFGEDKCPLHGGCAIGIEPEEFIFSQDGKPICSAFIPLRRNNDEVLERCTITKDLFRDAPA